MNPTQPSKKGGEINQKSDPFAEWRQHYWFLSIAKIHPDLEESLPRQQQQQQYPRASLQ